MLRLLIVDDERLEKIQLQFGNEYGVKIESIPGQGTTVIITIPKYKPGIN